MSSYYTIDNLSEGLYKEKGSKFLSFAFPVSSEEDIRKHLEDLRKKYHDARHYCYAWIQGLEQQNWRANDDGEPNHSAGDPILGQIRSFELTNVLVVVVRYFGGTKLGVGGLINAYKTAAEQALNKVPRIRVFEKVRLNFQFPYDLMSNVERLMSELSVEVVNRDFQENCRIDAHIRKEMIPELRAKTQDLYNLQVSINSDKS